MATLNTQRYIDRDSGALFTPRTDADTIKVMVKSGQWRPATEGDLEAHASKVTAVREARATRALTRATEAATIKASAEAAAQRALANVKAEAVAEAKPAKETKSETAKPAPEKPDAKPAPERPSRGASLAAWADFAKAVNFGHPEGASRDEIRDAYEAEHPAE